MEGSLSVLMTGSRRPGPGVWRHDRVPGRPARIASSETMAASQMVSILPTFPVHLLREGPHARFDDHRHDPAGIRLAPPGHDRADAPRWVASEALTLPRGGMTLVAEATGMSRTTIWAGVREPRDLSASPPPPSDPRRCRRPGGGRPRAEADDPRPLEDLERPVNPATRDDPMAPLRWTCYQIPGV